MNILRVTSIGNKSAMKVRHDSYRPRYRLIYQGIEEVEPRCIRFPTLIRYQSEFSGCDILDFIGNAPPYLLDQSDTDPPRWISDNDYLFFESQ